MAPVLAVTLIGVLALGLLLMLSFRRWALGEARAEASLLSLSPEDSLTYVVPDGQDPLAVMTALACGGYTCAADTKGGAERLIVACQPKERASVLAIIQRASAESRGSKTRDDVAALDRTKSHDG
jgi:hypothetical protein